MIKYIIILHVIVYILGFTLIAKKERYKSTITSIIITFGIVYTPFILQFIKPYFDDKGLKVVIVLFCYLSSLLLFLIIKSVFLKKITKNK